MWLNRETKKVKVLLTHHQEKLAELSYNPLISIIIPTRIKQFYCRSVLTQSAKKAAIKIMS